jgi:hypothetical protein
MPPDFEWVLVGDTPASGDSGYRNGNSLAFDAEGHCYVTGTFIDAIRFGSTNVPGGYAHIIFTAKLTPTGGVEWVRTAGGPGAIGTSVAVDLQGNCYVTGQYEGGARFGTRTLPWWGRADAFVAKYTGAGEVAWVSAAGGPGSDAGSSIAVDKQGNCYVAGHFEGTAIFGAEALIAPGSRDVFLAKYGPDGALLWLRQAHGSISASQSRVAVDGQGDCYIAGTFQGTATFGTNTLSSAGRSEDVYVARFSPDGEAQWAVRAGGVGSDYGNGIAVNEQGDIYVTGHFSGSADFLGTRLTSAGVEDVFVLRLSRAGEFRWVRQAGGVGDDWGGGIALDSRGDCYVIGGFQSIATFGATSLQSSGGVDVFLAKYSAEGVPLGVQKGGGPSNDYGFGVALDTNGRVGITGGFYSETAVFGTNVLASPNAGEAIFVATLRSSCLYFNPVSISLSNDLFQVQLNGLPGGLPVVIQASTDLSHWEDVGTNTPPAGALDVADPVSSSQPMRFYRARLGP